MNVPKPYQGNEKFIFISYSHRDTEKVFPIIARLMENGYRVWYDQGIDPGTEWDENIATHIDACGYFIAFMSGNYLGSSNCKDELNYARDLEKDRLIVYLEEVTLPAGMAMRINRIQSIFKYTYPDEDSFYEKLFTTNNIDVCLEEKIEKNEAEAPAAPAPEAENPEPAVSEPIKKDESIKAPSFTIPTIPDLAEAKEGLNKIKKRLLWSLIGVAAVIIIIVGIIIGISSSDSGYDDTIDYDTTDSDTTADTQGERLRSTFQLTHDNGNVAKIVLFYEDYVIYKYITSLTIPLEGDNKDEYVETLIESFDSDFEDAMPLTYCDIKYEYDDTSFTVRVTFSELDNISNLETLSDLGLLDTYTSGELLSFDLIKEKLQADGFKIVVDTEFYN